MKKHFLLIVGLFLSIATLCTAQVTEESKAMKLGTNNALVIEVDDANRKVAEKVWKDMMKKYRGKTKKKRKESQWTTEKVRLSTMTGQESANLYAQIEEAENVVSFSLWVPNGEEYVSADSHPEAYACLLYTSPSPRDATLSRMPSSA